MLKKGYKSHCTEGEINIFSVIWDGKSKRYRVKRTCLISLDELMNTYGSYKTDKDAQTVCKGLNRKQGSELSREAASFEKRKQA